MLLNNQEITEEIKEEIKKYLETNDNENMTGASMVAQWLKICLSMQGTRVRALAREYPTCHGATKPMHHNY